MLTSLSKRSTCNNQSTLTFYYKLSMCLQSHLYDVTCLFLSWKEGKPKVFWEKEFPSQTDMGPKSRLPLDRFIYWPSTSTYPSLHKKEGQERWLLSQEPLSSWFLAQYVIQFPAPTWRLTTACNCQGIWHPLLNSAGSCTHIVYRHTIRSTYIKSSETQTYT